MNYLRCSYSPVLLTNTAYFLNLWQILSFLFEYSPYNILYTLYNFSSSRSSSSLKFWENYLIPEIYLKRSYSRKPFIVYLSKLRAQLIPKKVRRYCVLNNLNVLKFLLDFVSYCLVVLKVFRFIVICTSIMRGTVNADLMLPVFYVNKLRKSHFIDQLICNRK
jgi:hypothetical protein